MEVYTKAIKHQSQTRRIMTIYIQKMGYY